MRILIVDDEAPARSRLRALVEESAAGEVVGEAGHGREALELTRRHQPHVILLDIRMPGMDGIEAARHLARLEAPPAVIFTTAYDEHALQAFQTGAVAYLLKPIRQAKLAEALQAARRLNRVQLEALQAAAGETARTHISARVGGDIVLVEVAEVRYFLAEHKYVTVGYPGGTVLIEDSLKTLEQEFAGSFLRVHRNALAASAHVQALERTRSGRHRLRLRGVDQTLEISRRHLPALRRCLQN